MSTVNAVFEVTGKYDRTEGGKMGYDIACLIKRSHLTLIMSFRFSGNNIDRVTVGLNP